MKKYNVTVNGNIYQVEVEEVKGDFTAPVAAPVQAAAPKAAPAPAAAPKAAAPKANVAGEKVESPMPGTIVKVNVTEGATVKKGDVLFVLEAMKMENEIMSNVDGKVAQVNVAKGASVDTGTVLAVIA